MALLTSCFVAVNECSEWRLYPVRQRNDSMSCTVFGFAALKMADLCSADNAQESPEMSLPRNVTVFLAICFLERLNFYNLLWRAALAGPLVTLRQTAAVGWNGEVFEVLLQGCIE